MPTLTVLVGILLNRSDTNRLDARITTELAAPRADLTADLNSLKSAVARDLNSLKSALANDLNPLKSTVAGDLNSLKSAVNADVRSLSSAFIEIREDIKLIRNDRREFYRTLGQHEVPLDNIEKK